MKLKIKNAKLKMDEKKRLRLNLKKAKSLIERIERMVEEDEYCPKIMQQILAAIGLLRSVHKGLMVRHLKTCFVEAAKSGDKKKQQEMIEEILKVIDLYNK